MRIAIEFDPRFLTHFGSYFRPFWEPLGSHLGVLGDHLGGLERSLESLSPSLGASWSHLGSSWLYFELFWTSRTHFGGLQASFWSLWGPILDPSGQTIHHLVGIRKFQAINENLSSSTDQKGSKQTYLRSMQPSSQTII